MSNRKLKRLIRKKIYDLLTKTDKPAATPAELVNAQALADVLKCL